MEIHLTYAGILSLVIILLTWIKYRFNFFKLITDPIFLICYSFYNFFGHYGNLDFKFENEVLLFTSFVVYISTYYIIKKTKLTALDRLLINFPKREIATKGSSLISTQGIVVFFTLSISYCVLDLVINALIFGSVERAMIRFYSNFIERPEFVSLKHYLALINQIMFALIFVYRYFLNLYRKDSALFSLGVIMLMIIAIPGGSRGAVLGPLTSLILADIFAKRFHNISLKRHLIQYIYLGAFGAVSFLVLTSIRSIRFESFRDVKDVVKLVDLSSSAEQYKELEGDLMISDTKLCFDKFGKKIDYLPVYYTAEAIALSWIPRPLWIEKPVSFGLVINAVKNGEYSIVDKPQELNYPGAVDWAAGVAGEGWANGGFIGLIMYSILFGIISGKSARIYYALVRYKNNYIAIVLALFMFRMSSCFLRGGLQSTFTPSLYTLILLLILIKIFYFKHESIRSGRCLG